MCPQHKEKVSAFCETCSLCICHECVLWETSPHRGHCYIKLEVLLQKQTKICEVEVGSHLCVRVCAREYTSDPINLKDTFPPLTHCLPCSDHITSVISSCNVMCLYGRDSANEYIMCWCDIVSSHDWVSLFHSLTQLRKLREHMKSVLNQVQSVERKMEAVKGSKIKVRHSVDATCDRCTSTAIPVARIT